MQVISIYYSISFVVKTIIVPSEAERSQVKDLTYMNRVFCICKYYIKCITYCITHYINSVDRVEPNSGDSEAWCAAVQFSSVQWSVVSDSL